MSNEIFVEFENIENETTLTGEQGVLELIIDQWSLEKLKKMFLIISCSLSSNISFVPLFLHY